MPSGRSRGADQVSPKDDMMRDPLSSAHAKCVSTFQEREEVPVMAIVGGFDIHRRQVTFDYLDTVTGQVRRGRVSPACRETLRHWLERFAGRADVTFAVEGCTGWRFVVEELQRAGDHRAAGRAGRDRAPARS